MHKLSAIKELMEFDNWQGFKLKVFWIFFLMINGEVDSPKTSITISLPLVSAPAVAV
jgi:hypothetical protein